MAYIDGVTYNGTDYSLYCSGGVITSTNALSVAASGSSAMGGQIILYPGLAIGDLTGTTGGAIYGTVQPSGQSPTFPLIFYLNLDPIPSSFLLTTALHIGNDLFYPLVLQGTDISYRHVVNNNSVTEKFTFKSDFEISSDGTILTINLD